MRVTNTMLVNQAVAAMQSALAQIGASQARLATGRQLRSPADDPAGQAAATRIQARLAATVQLKRQAQQAGSTLTAYDAALAQLHELLTRADELAVSGASDGKSATDRSAMAAEVNGLLEESVGVANTVEDNRYLFGGQETLTAPLTVTRDASGRITAAAWNPRGVDAAITLEIDEGVMMQTNVGGTAVFGAATDATFVPALLVSLRDALRSNDGEAVRGLIDQIKSAESRLADPSADVGGRLRQVEETLANLDTDSTGAQAALSAILDADVGRVATQLGQQELMYKASLSAAAQAIQPSLLEFLT
jgi:flagellar hook-associated protein 3 FlgL